MAEELEEPEAPAGPLPAWDDVADKFTTAFPGLDADMMKSRYEQARKLSVERDRYSGAEETTAGWLGRRAIPFGSTAVNVARQVSASRAMGRIQQGNPDEGDYELVAAHERLQELDAGQSTGQQVVSGLAHMPAILGEYATGAAALRGLGLGGQAAAEATPFFSAAGARAAASAAPGVLARGAAITPLVPSSYAERAVHNNLAEGRDPLDWRGLPSAYLLGVAQNSVLGSLGHVAEGVPNLAGRLAARTATGLAEQQGVDVLASAADDAAKAALGNSMGLHTGYGTLGSFVRGEPDAMSRAVVQVVTFAAFAGLHELQARPREEAGEPGPAGSQPPREGPAAGPPEGPRPEGPAGEVPPVVQAFADAINYYQRRGLNRRAVGSIFEGISRDLSGEMQRNPDMTRSDAAFFFQGSMRDAPAPLRKFMQELINAFPERRQARPQTAPETPTPEAEVVRRAEIAAPPERPVEPPGAPPASAAQQPPETATERPAEAPAAAPLQERPLSAPAEPSANRTADVASGPATPTVPAEVSAPARRTPAERLEGMRKRQETLVKEAPPAAPALGPHEMPLQERDPIRDLARQVAEGTERPEQLTPAEIDAEARTSAMRYDKLPEELRTRSREVLGRMEGVDPKSVLDTHLAAFAGGGKEGLEALLELQESRLRPPDLKVDPYAIVEDVLKEFRDEVARAARLAQREGLAPDVVRRRLEETVRGADQVASGRGAGEAAPRRQAQARQSPQQVAQARREQLAKNRKAPTLLSILKEHGGLSEQSVASHGFDPKILKQEIPSVFKGYDKGDRQAAKALLQKHGAVSQMPPAEQKEYTRLMRRTVPGKLEMTEAAEHLRDEGHLVVPIDSPLPLHEILHDLLVGRAESLESLTDKHYAREYEEYLKLKEEAHQAGYSREYLAKVEAEGREAGAASQRQEPSESTVERFESEASERDSSASADLPPGALDFPFGFNEPAGDNPARQQRDDAASRRRAIELARDFLKDEAGHLDPEAIRERVLELAGDIRRTTTKVADYLLEFSGKMGPRTTRLSRLSGEALARYNASAGFAKAAAPYFVDKVMGEHNTPEMRRLVGAALTESRLRYMKQVFAGEGDKAAAAKVTSIVGKPGSPFKSEGDFLATLRAPEVQTAIQRYRALFVPEMEKHYRKAEGLTDEEPIESKTQIPGFPINLKALREGDVITEGTVFTSGGRGNLRNVRAGKLGFARKAKGDAAGYETDLGLIMENTLSRSVTLGAKHEMMRTMVEEGVAQWGKPGERVDLGGQPAKAVPFVKPPPRVQAAQQGQDTLYVHERVYPELRQALAVDQPFKIPAIEQAANILTAASLASTVEMAYHSKNLMTMLFRPRMGMRSLYARTLMYGYKVLTKNPEVLGRLVELARIGAAKESAVDIPGALGKYNPLKWTGEVLHVLDKMIRLTAEDAFDSMVRSKLAEDTETNKRDFINQLGQYNRKAQNHLVVLLRDTQIGPFATAGTNYLAQGLKSLLMRPGVQSTSWLAGVQLQAEMLAKALLLVGLLVPMANYAMWGRADGDDYTPYGSVKTGIDPASGKTRSFGVANLIGLTRGARVTGLLALTEGLRGKKSPQEIGDQAFSDVVHSLMHPALGPVAQFAYTAGTGKNTLGMNVTPKVYEGESKTWAHFKAAIANANPVYATVSGADRPDQDPSAIERLNRLAGPFGLQSR